MVALEINLTLTHTQLSNNIHIRFYAILTQIHP
jgi:hypothetical protein